MKSTPTPSPWTLQPSPSGGAILVRGETAGKHPQHMLQIVPLEDAEFIVRCVNAHQALAEACEAALDELMRIGNGYLARRDRVEQLKAALKLAKGDTA